MVVDMNVSPARKKHLEAKVDSALTELGAEQVHRVIAAFLQRQNRPSARAGRGAPKYFSEAVYRDIWITVQLHILATGSAAYRACMTLKMRFIIDGKMKDVSGKTLYRQYQHAIRLMKGTHQSDEKVDVNCSNDVVSTRERLWRRELQLLSNPPASALEHGRPALCGN